MVAVPLLASSFCCCAEETSSVQVLEDEDTFVLARSFSLSATADLEAPPTKPSVPGEFSEVEEDGDAVSTPCRPVSVGEEFTVSLRKGPEEAFGIQVRQSTTTTEIFVKSLGRGLIQEWNAAHPERSVKLGDRLVSVNGVTGPRSSDIIREMMCHKKIELVFASCGGSPLP